MLQEQELNTAKKLGKCILLISCLFFIGIQVGELIFLLVNNPIVAKREILKSDVPLPGISFCGLIEEVNPNFEKYTEEDINSITNEELNNRNLTNVFFKRLKYPYSYVYNCTIGNYSCTERNGNNHLWKDHISFHNSMIELCSTMIAQVNDSNLNDVDIQFYYDSTPTMEVVLHDPRHVAPHNYRLDDINTFYAGSKKVVFYIEMKTKAAEAISQESRPCNGSEEYDPNKKLEDRIYSELMRQNDTCVPPWRSDSQRVCQSYEAILRMGNKYEAIKINTVLPTPSCKKWSYESTFILFDTDFDGHFHFNMLRENGFERIFQDYRYSVLSFVSEVGAILTIFGGYSILSIIEILINAAKEGIENFIQHKYVMRAATLLCILITCNEERHLITSFMNSDTVFDFTLDHNPTADIVPVGFCYLEQYNTSVEESSIILDQHTYESLLLHPRLQFTDCVYLGEKCMEDEGAQYKWITEYNLATVCDIITFKQRKDQDSPAVMQLSIDKQILRYATLCIFLNQPVPIRRSFVWSGCHYYHSVHTVKHSLRFETSVTDRFTECNPNYENCFDQCWVRQLVKKELACDLPWKSYGNNLTACKNMEEFGELTDLASDNHRSALSFDLKLCECNEPCYQKNYDVIKHKLPTTNEHDMEILFTPSGIEIETERMEFTFWSFLSQAGGLAALILPWAFLDFLLMGLDVVKQILCKSGVFKERVYNAIAWIVTVAMYVCGTQQLCEFFIMFHNNPKTSSFDFAGWNLEDMPTVSTCYMHQLWELNKNGQLLFCILNEECENVSVTSAEEFEKYSSSKISDIKDITNETGYDCNFYGVDCNSLIQDGHLTFSVYMSPFHFCSTLTWNSTLDRIFPDSKIQFHASNYWASDVYFHGRYETVTPYYRQFYSLQPSVLQKNRIEQRDFKVNLKKYYHDQNCITRFDYNRDQCVDVCINNDIEKQLQCRLVWNTESTYPRLCYKGSDYVKAYDALYNVTAESLEKCNCLPRCDTYLYKFTEALSYYRRRVLPYTFFMEDDTVSLSIYQRYSFVSVVAMVAGIISLFSGDSFFTLAMKIINNVHWLADLMTRWFRK